MKPNTQPSATLISRIFDPKIWPMVVTMTVFCGIGVGAILAWTDSAPNSSSAANYQPARYAVAQIDAEIPAAATPVEDDLLPSDFPELTVEIDRRPKPTIAFDAQPIYIAGAASSTKQSHRVQRLSLPPIVPETKNIARQRLRQSQQASTIPELGDSLLESFGLSATINQPTSDNNSARAMVESPSTMLPRRFDQGNSKNPSAKIIRFQRPAIDPSLLQLQPLQAQIRQPKNASSKPFRSAYSLDNRTRGLLASSQSTIDDPAADNQSPQPTTDSAPLPDQAKIETRSNPQTGQPIADPIKNLSLAIDLPNLENKIHAAGNPDDRPTDPASNLPDHRMIGSLPAVEVPSVKWSFEQDDADQPPMPKYTSVSGKITLDGTPLANATIKFLPVARQGKTVSATTDGLGQFTISAAKDARRPGIQPGKYQVRITTYVESSDLNVIDLLETVPEKYNAKTQLSVEIKMDAPNVFNADLTSD